MGADAQSRETAGSGGHRRLGHQCSAGRHRPPARQWYARSRSARLFDEMRSVPRRKRQRRVQCATRRRRSDQRYGDRKDHRKLLAFCDNAFRLHSPGHALAAATDAFQRRSLCADGLHSVFEQIDWRKRGNGRANASESPDAQQEWFHSSLPGQVLRSWSMRNCRILISIWIAVLISASGSAFGQAKKTWAMPRTPDGHPDLSGSWNTSTLTPLERPAEFAQKPVLSEQEAKDYEARLLRENN